MSTDGGGTVASSAGARMSTLPAGQGSGWMLGVAAQPASPIARISDVECPRRSRTAWTTVINALMPAGTAWPAAFQGVCRCEVSRITSATSAPGRRSRHRCPGLGPTERACLPDAELREVYPRAIHTRVDFPELGVRQT